VFARRFLGQPPVLFPNFFMFARQSGAKTAHRLDSSDNLGNVHLFDAAPRELPAGLALYFTKSIEGILVVSPADYLKMQPR